MSLVDGMSRRLPTGEAAKRLAVGIKSVGEEALTSADLDDVAYRVAAEGYGEVAPPAG